MSPWVPVVIVGGVVAAGVTAWAFLRGKDGGDGDGFEPPPPGPVPPSPDDEKIDQKPKPAVPVCSRTGTEYDIDRFGSPVEVAAYLVSLGYPVSPSLVTVADKAEIKRFQRRGRQLGLPGLKGIEDKWIHGQMSPCTLVALGHAVDLLQDGQWDLAKARSA